MLVTPTYAWRIPRIVEQWLEATPLPQAQRIWFVMDCGSEIGSADHYNRQLAQRKQLRPMGTAPIQMPENYIAMFSAPDPAQARRIVDSAAPAIQQTIDCIQAGQPFAPTRQNLYDRFMSGPVNPIFYRFFVKAGPFRADDRCIGCGQCVQRCPLNNIRLTAGRPVWGSQCTHCMACISYCPTQAIEYGKKAWASPVTTSRHWSKSKLPPVLQPCPPPYTTKRPRLPVMETGGAAVLWETPQALQSISAAES